MKRTILAVAAAAVVLAGCTSTTSSDSSSAAPQGNRAVVLVSGGGTSTPFTTPTQACKDGEGYQAAGNTYTDIRAYLLEMGKQVYTAPVMDQWGPVQDPTDDRPGPFTDCPIVLPEAMTIMSTGDLSAGGERLARFLNYLNTEYGITDMDIVGHSNGGLWSRSAIWVLKNTDSPITVRSLTMMGTPNNGSVPGRYTVGEITLDDCAGNAYCEQALKSWIPLAEQLDRGLNVEDTQKYLDGPGVWNAAQGNALDGIPVTLIAGTYFEEPGGNPTVWPYDGTVARYSVFGTDIPDAIMPWRTCWEAPLLHTIYQSSALNVPWDTAMTHNTEAIARVNQAIDEADTALEQPNRQGC